MSSEFSETFYRGERIAVWKHDLHPSVLEKYEEVLNSVFLIQMIPNGAAGFAIYKCTMKTPNPEGKDGVFYGPSIRDIAGYIVDKFVEGPNYVEYQYEPPSSRWWVGDDEAYSYSTPLRWWKWVDGRKTMYYTASIGA
jgi:hypothetical protein